MTEINETVVSTDEVLAKIIKEDDGYHVVNVATGEIGPVCKLVDEGGKTIALTKNDANRLWANKAKADQAIEEQGFFPLYYKATKKLGPQGNRIPNEKLIKYLPEDLQAEYHAIIARAIEAKEAEKAKPMTELEKAQAKLAKAQAAYDKLIAEAQAE